MAGSDDLGSKSTGGCEETRSAIAVVGVACALPSGSYSEKNLDYAALGDFLMRGGEAYQEIPQERFNVHALHGPHAGQIKTTKGAFLKDASIFDHLEFGITLKDAMSMSLSTRRLIELAFLALLDSGIDYRGKAIGCFMAGTTYGVLDQDEYDMEGSMAGATCMIANRVSYALDLEGPSVTVDTACSSTMTATHLAIQAILSGDCEAAIVGGCQYNDSFLEWVNYSQAGVLAPDGKCKSFDAKGDGFGRGEGAAVIVLKPVNTALSHHDHIYTNIIGSAINSTGASAAPSVPVGASQKDCIRRAYQRSGKRPTDVDYVELHATGTAVGDPIEANAAGEVFCRKNGVEIGSVKGNLGHLEITACLAALLKICHIFEKQMIPPQVNLCTLNPAIHWQEYGLEVTTTAKPLSKRSSLGKALASISSSGIGGTNGHLVLEQSPKEAFMQIPVSEDLVLILAGGLSPRSAEANANAIGETLALRRQNSALLSFICARRARQMSWRTFIVLSPDSIPRFPKPTLVSRSKPFFVFVISGQGPQHLQMGCEFYKTNTVFRNSINEMDQTYKRITGKLLTSTTGLFSQPLGSHMALPEVWPIAVTLPALTMFQVALIDLLSSVGVRPDAIVGHSAGETALLYASGAASKDMVVEIAVARGLSMTVLETKGGTMAALSCNPAVAHELIVELGDKGHKLEIACHNSPEAVAVSGPLTSVDAIVELAATRGIWARRLRTNVPVHSSMMEMCRSDYETRVGKVFERYSGGHFPKVTTLSTLTGQPFSESFTAKYFWQNARERVRFSEAVAHLHRLHPEAAYIEISPHPVLSTYISAICTTPIRTVCPSRRPNAAGQSEELYTFLNCLGQLALIGCNTITPLNLIGTASVRGDSTLPPYPFVNRHVPLHVNTPAHWSSKQEAHGPLNRENLRLNAETHPDLAQHVIQGQPIMPAAGFLEMVFERGARIMWDVNFHMALSLASARPLPVQVHLTGSNWAIRSCSGNHSASPALPTNYDRLHADGRLSFDRSTGMEPLDVQAVKLRLESAEMTEFNNSIATFAQFGPAFCRIEELYTGENELLAYIRGIRQEDEIRAGYLFYPPVLDACFQAGLFFLEERASDVYYLPAKVGCIRISDDALSNGLPPILLAHILYNSWTPDEASFDIKIVTLDGQWVCSLESFVMARHRTTARRETTGGFEAIWQPMRDPYSPLLSTNGNFQLIFDQSEPVRALYRTLDALADQAIRRTILEHPFVGPEVHRQRYSAFAKRVAAGEPMGTAMQEAELRSRWPAHFEITDRISRVHPDVFRTSKVAVEALFADDIMTAFYGQNSDIAGICKVTAVAFRNLLASLVASGKRVIRVLEVGTGTGALTSYLIPILSEFPSVFIEYVATDLSGFLVSGSLDRFSYPHIRSQAYNIALPPAEQGLVCDTYDIVTGLLVVHATPSVQSALQGLSQLLVPGGSLLLIELDGTRWESKPGTLWFDFIFGCFSEWFAFEDSELRNHCIMPLSRWADTISSAGFETFETISDTNTNLHVLIHSQKSVVVVSSKQNHVQMVHYTFGKETTLRECFAQFDTEDPLEVWLLSTVGLDGDALLGLSRSLAREYPLWMIHSAVFPVSISKHERESILLLNLPSLHGEPDVRFDPEGLPTVFRVIPLAPASRLLPFSPDKPWRREGLDVVHTPLPCLRQYDVLVRVSSWSLMAGAIRGFSGKIIDVCGASDCRIDDNVFGVTAQPEGNMMAVHRGCIGVLRRSSKADIAFQKLADVAIGFCIARAATVTWSQRSGRASLPFRTVLLLRDSRISNETIEHVLRLLNWKVSTVSIDSNLHCLPSKCTKATFDLVIGSYVQLQALDSFPNSPSYARCYSWDDSSNGLLALITKDPWAIGEYLEYCLDYVDQHQLEWLSEHPPLAPLLPLPGTPVQKVGLLFDPNKSYLLVGGMGGVGIRVAVWMYTKGARHIVLTSRKGPETVKFLQEKTVVRALAYLTKKPDLQLRVEACDATCLESMRGLLASIQPSLAGCMLLPLVISDGLFVSQTQESYKKVISSKLDSLRVLESTVHLTSLDFCITFSSAAGLLGNGGQSNYASACTAMDGLTLSHPNAFSLIVPGITDVGYLARKLQNDRSSATNLAEWGITCDELCESIEDGILKLSEGRLWCYIPTVNWVSVGESMGISMSFQHLASDSGGKEKTQEIGAASKTLCNVVCDMLHLSAEDFRWNVPLTQYGLDSLAAVRLSGALRPFGNVSQLQLLGDMTLNDIEQKFAERSDEEDVLERQGSGGEITAFGAAGSDEILVKLNDLPGIPLIVLHGGEGSIQPLSMLQETFSSALWAIQMTSNTPMTSIQTLADFYFHHIKAERPQGPYRLATFSASSTIGICLTKLLEDTGDEVVQLAFLDHFPSVIQGIAGNLKSVLVSDSSTFKEPHLKTMLKIMHGLFERDKKLRGRELLQRELEKAIRGESVPKFVHEFLQRFLRYNALVVQLAIDCAGAEDGAEEISPAVDVSPFVRYLAGVKAPVTLFVATEGMRLALPVHLRAVLWDLGLKTAYPHAKVYEIEAGHFDMLGTHELARLLQTEWARSAYE